ncbi:MAG: glycosyltransferase family 61 protein [Microbacteriaceae bacterium]|nr:glycosyltransferase family 61 protein [Microbacteriaceae bacterium]
MTYAARYFVEDLASFTDCSLELDHDLIDTGLPGVTVIDNGIVLPLKKDGLRVRGGVLDDSGRFVAGHETGGEVDENGDWVPWSTRRSGRFFNPTVSEGYPVSEGVRQGEGPALFLSGLAVHHFGHMITEGISRFWYLLDGISDEMKIVLPFPPEEPAVRSRDLGAQGFIELLELFGVPESRIEFLTAPTRFDQVIIPDQSLTLLSGRINIEMTKRVYDRLRDAVGVPSRFGSRIYLSRSSFSPSPHIRESNEDLFEDFYRDNGFDVVQLETMPFAEQIATLRDAHEVAAPAGTPSHLVAFCHDGVRFTSLLRAKAWNPPIQPGLFAMREAEVAYVDCLLSLFPDGFYGGLKFYSRTAEWVDYAREWFGAAQTEMHPADSPAEIGRYVLEWADLAKGAASASARALSLLWPIDSARLVRLLSTAAGAPLDEAATDRLESWAGHLDARLAALEAQVKSLESEKQALGRSRDALKKRNADILGSWSWRIGNGATWPLRKVAQASRHAQTSRGRRG